MKQDGVMIGLPGMSLRPVDHIISPRMGPQLAAKGVACSTCEHIIPVKPSDSAAVLLELQ
jgi:hypothetical protein